MAFAVLSPPDRRYPELGHCGKMTTKSSAQTHDISRINYHLKDLKVFGETLTDAVAGAFPNKGRSRYSEVHVLLLSWEDDNLGVIAEGESINFYLLLLLHTYILHTLCALPIPRLGQTEEDGFGMLSVAITHPYLAWFMAAWFCNWFADNSSCQNKGGSLICNNMRLHSS